MFIYLFIQQETKAAASQRAPADQPTGAKAPPPTKGQEIPGTKVSHPMATRSREASRAGGLRGVVGSGSTGYVCDKSSPSSKPGSESFSSAEIFLPHPIQRRSMAQRDNRLPIMGTWHAPPRSRRYTPLSGAARYPAGARPSKCIIIINRHSTLSIQVPSRDARVGEQSASL
jgi:hypothetical protein